MALITKAGPIVWFSCVMLSGCDYNLTVTGPSAGIPSAIVNTNTNTNNNQNDRADTGAVAAAETPPPGGSSGNNVLPLPSYAEGVVRSLAASNQMPLARACLDVPGDLGWEFLDLVVRTLRSQDLRWGYLCKDSACLTFGADVIAYRATATDTGIWIVDIINDCGGTNGIRYGVLPFDLTRRWTASRKAGVFP